MGKYKYPIIIDTDIGDDIDDTWALSFIIASSYFDIRLIMVSNYDTNYKARLVAKLLQTYNKTDIPIGITLKTKCPDNYRFGQGKWLKDFKLEDYKGMVYKENVYKIAAEMTKKEKIAFFSLGTSKTFEVLLDNYPFVKDNSFIIAMLGSINKGYEGKLEQCVEYNVGTNINSTKKVLESNWEYVMLPLDVCSTLKLKGKNYERLIKSDSIYAKTLVENYKCWLVDSIFPNDNVFEKGSSILFDIIVPWYAMFNDKFIIKKDCLYVDDKGFIKKGKDHQITYAIDLKDVEELYTKTIDILTK